MKLTRFRFLSASFIAYAGLCAAPSNSPTHLIVAPDPTLRAEIQIGIRAAYNAKDWAKVVGESRRLLEFYPNEPAVRAPIYAAMAEASDRANNPAQAAQFRAAAAAIDPGLPARLSQPGSGIDIVQVLSVAMRTATVLERARKAARMTSQVAAPDSSSSVIFPKAAVGSSLYQPPADGYLPPPAYDPAVYSLIATVELAAPQAAAAKPAALPTPETNIVIQPADPQPPGMRKPAAYATLTPPKPPAPEEQLETVQAAMQRTPMYIPRQPYAAPARYRASVESLAPVAVIVDRSTVDDAAFFTRACGALIGVADGNLTLTTSCGDAPYVIPAAEITEIRLNGAVGRDAGIFHVATQQGLYLQLALDPTSREASARLIAALRAPLGLPE